MGRSAVMAESLKDYVEVVKEDSWRYFEVTTVTDYPVST